MRRSVVRFGLSRQQEEYKKGEVVKVTIEVAGIDAQRLVAALEQAWYDAELGSRSSRAGKALVVVRHVRDPAVLRAVATEHTRNLMWFRMEEDD